MLKRMRKMNSLSTLVLLVLLMTACTPISQTFRDTFKEQEPDVPTKETSTTLNEEDKKVDIDGVTEREEVPEPINFLSDSAALAKAQQQLLELPQFQNKDLNFYSSIHFYGDGRVNIQLQDPDNLEYVDAYGYRDGRWGKPQAVRISVQTDLHRSLAPLDAIKFTSVAAIFNQIVAKSQDIEGAEEVTHIYFVHSPVFGKKEWYASVTGTREHYSIRADIEGKKVSFQQN